MMNAEDKVAVSQLYIKLHEEGCSTPFQTSMELFYMDKIVENLSKMVENTDKLNKILNMMDSRLLGLSENIETLNEDVTGQLQVINQTVGVK